MEPQSTAVADVFGPSQSAVEDAHHLIVPVDGYAEHRVASLTACEDLDEMLGTPRLQRVVLERNGSAETEYSAREAIAWVYHQALPILASVMRRGHHACRT